MAFINGILTGNARLLLMTRCVCPGTLITYQCTVSGGGTTVWQGSSFSCDNSDDGTLPLRHSRFDNGSLIKECNSDNIMIVAREIEVMGDNYTSQLIIPVTQEIDTKTVECAHDNGTITTVVGTSTVNITSGLPL